MYGIFRTLDLFKFRYMATVKYFLRGKKEIKSITLQLSISKGNQPERKTGFSISKKQWSTDIGFPKQTLVENKKLASILRKLKDNVLDNFNQAQAEGIITNGQWLKDQIDICFERIAPSGQSELVIDSIDSLLETADVRKNQKGRNGLSRSRKNDYIAL